MSPGALPGRATAQAAACSWHGVSRTGCHSSREWHFGRERPVPPEEEQKDTGLNGGTDISVYSCVLFSSHAAPARGSCCPTRACVMHERHGQGLTRSMPQGTTASQEKAPQGRGCFPCLCRVPCRSQPCLLQEPCKRLPSNAMTQESLCTGIAPQKVGLNLTKHLSRHRAKGFLTSPCAGQLPAPHRHRLSSPH